MRKNPLALRTGPISMTSVSSKPKPKCVSGSTKKAVHLRAVRADKKPLSVRYEGAVLTVNIPPDQESTQKKRVAA